MAAKKLLEINLASAFSILENLRQRTKADENDKAVEEVFCIPFVVSQISFCHELFGFAMNICWTKTIFVEKKYTQIMKRLFVAKSLAILNLLIKKLVNLGYSNRNRCNSHTASPRSQHGLKVSGKA